MKLPLFCLTLLLTLPAKAQLSPLAHGFQHPPSEARPRVWWHWMEGNVSKEGIALDLAWMKRIGLGGLQMFDANLGPLGVMTGGMPLDLTPRVVFGTPEWQEHLRFATEQAHKNGLEFTVHASGGWSETGGPWVKPEQAMKKYVWSELAVEGGKQQTLTLPKPPTNAGPFQSFPLRSPFGMPTPSRGSFYRDAAVVAFPTPPHETRLPSPTVTTSAGPLEGAERLWDGDLSQPISLPAPTAQKPVWVRYAFSSPQTLRAITLSIGTPSPFGGSPIPEGVVEGSLDGARYTRLALLPGPGHVAAAQRTLAFPATSVRYLRVTFTKMPTDPLAAMLGGGATPLSIAELAPHAAPRLHRFEEKAGFGTFHDDEALAAPPAAPGDSIASSQVRNLTPALRPDGTVALDLPPGKWTVLRIGYTLTGKENSPANPEATGLEVDKLSASHVRAYLATYLQQLGPALKDIDFVLTDSWEAGQQTWTDTILAEFAARRGYSALPYLPILAGHIVGSAEVSDRFLRDFRRTIADLLSDNHYRVLATELKKQGIRTYGESMGANLPTVGDGLLNKRHATIPMGEFWFIRPGEQPKPEHDSDIREAASAAHLYGQNLVAAEAFTAQAPGWSIAPWNIKWLADRYLALGVNRFVIHTSVHQPFTNRKPGVTLALFGQYFTRNETWAEQAGPWIDYLSRCSYLLQQGHAVVDAAVFYGDGAPVAAPFEKPFSLPAGHAFDYIGADALLNELSVQRGELTTRSGMRYRVLVLPDHTRRLTLPVLKKLRQLVAAGAKVCGPRPVGSPSLSDSPTAVAEAIAVLWDTGKVAPPTALAHLLSLADLESPRGAKLAWAHRTLPDTELYFVANQTDQPQSVPVTFRVAGREAELWHPDTGTSEPARFQTHGTQTTVPLTLTPYDSVFVVFHKKSPKTSRTLPVRTWQPVTLLSGPWEVRFPEGSGAPLAATFPALLSWTAHPDPGIQHFSGTASYRTTFTAPEQGSLALNLGTVKELAEVLVNGKSLATLWKPPFRVSLDSALKPGTNTLEIRVTNLWANRMIGDEKGIGGKRYTWATTNPYKSGPQALLPSGLLGPVILEKQQP